MIFSAGYELDTNILLSELGCNNACNPTTYCGFNVSELVTVYEKNFLKN